jgi:hypothetical protein
MKDDPFAKLGALDQKLFVSPSLSKGQTQIFPKRRKQPSKEPAGRKDREPVERPNIAREIKSAPDQSSQLTGRLSGQPADQSTDQSTDRLTSKVVARPKAFYITERLDQKLDQAVRYFQDRHGIKKVDRSAIVNALLDNEANWTDQALDRLVSRVIGQLASRLTG